MASRLKEQVWAALEQRPSPGAKPHLGQFFAATIILGVVAAILESIESLQARYSMAFATVEAVCLSIFAVEYGVRLWAAGAVPKYRGVRGRLKWATSFFALIDLLALLPGILFWLDFDLRIVRAVRLLRLFRLGRYGLGLRVLTDAFRGARPALSVAASGVLILLLVASTVVYYAEKAAQPQAFGSIPDAMWWGVCTLTTVGYGDVYPVTPIGKFLAGIISVLGVGSFAVPAGILAAHFEKATRSAAGQSWCPKCGRALD